MNSLHARPQIPRAAASLGYNLTTMISVGEMVRRERRQSGLSIRDLATLAGLSYPAISRIENGHEQPRWDTLEKLAAALGKAVSPVFVERLVPKLGDLANRWSWDRDGHAEPDWTAWRGFADEMSLHPEFVGVAIDGPILPSGSPLVDNLLAAIAEKLAADAGIREPRWTRDVPPLRVVWTAPGTPRMQADHAANTPVQFSARNITLPASAIWRERELVLA